MLISLSEVMNCRDQEIRMSVPVGFDVFSQSKAEYPVCEKSELSLLLVSDAAKKVHISAQVNIVLKAPCDRCLEEVRLPFDLCIEQEVDFSKTGQEQAEELDEKAYISGFGLDTDQLIFEELLVAFPAKVLCFEDCKGICGVCGANLNDGECGCDRTVSDPRMAAIRDIFNNFKEV